VLIYPHLSKSVPSHPRHRTYIGAVVTV